MELALGILIALVGILHIAYGEMQPLKELARLNADPILIGSVRVMSLQGGVLLIFLGAVHLANAGGMISLTGAQACLPVTIISLNLLAFLLTAAFKHRELLKITAVQLILFAIIIALEVIVLVNKP